MKKPSRHTIPAMAAWACICAPAAAAGEYPLWEIGAGLAALSVPEYRGSDEQQNYALPIPYLVYRGERLRVNRDKVSGLLLRGDNWEFDLSASAGVPVRSDHNAARSGMPDLDPTVELGPQLIFTLAGGRNESHQLDLRLPVRQVWAADWPNFRQVGRIFHPVANLDVRGRWPGAGWNLGFQAGPIFTDADFHAYYYAVDTAYARADRPAYAAKGGYSGLQATASLSRRFDKLWVGAFIRANDLHGAAIENSPLVRRKTNLTGGIGASWVFGSSATRVEARE